MSKGRLHARVPVKTVSRSQYRVFGREFNFDPASLADKARAMAEAETYGESCIQAFEKRMGRPASLREQLTLSADAPPEAPYSGSLRRETEPTNPYRQRMDDISKWSEVHDYQRARKQRRMEAMQKSADEWDRQHGPQVESAARQASPDFIRALAHADKRLDEMRLDPSVSQEAVESMVQARKDLESGKLSAGGYFQTMTNPAPDHGGNLYE